MAELRFDAKQVLKRFSEIEQRQLFAIETYGKAAGNKMVADAKRHHPWTNRTAMAQNTIASHTKWHGAKLRVNLTSGVHYGVHLEFKRFKHKGRLSIFFPTVKKFEPEVLKAWAERTKRG